MYNGNGEYDLPTPEYPAIAGTVILAEDYNTILEDIASALSSVLVRDGQAPMQGTLDMDGNSLTNVNEVAARSAGGSLTGNWTLASTVLGVTQAVGTNNTSLATTAFANALAFAAALPGQAGNADKFVTTDGTNASFSGNLKTSVMRFVDGTDATKIAAFDAGSITTATTRTFTFPNVSGTFLTTGAAVTVSQGGTGAATFTDGGVVIGNGTGALQITSAGTVGQVLTSTGAGSAPTFQDTQSPTLHVRDERSSGTVGGSASPGYTIRVLNTVVTNTITGASLASDAVTLPAGTYDYFASAPANGNLLGHRLDLFNSTDASFTSRGLSAYISALNQNLFAVSFGRFTIAAQKVFQLRHYITGTQATNGLGVAIGEGGVNEVFTSVQFWKR